MAGTAINIADIEEVEKYEELTREITYDVADDGKVPGDVSEIVYMLAQVRGDADEEFLFKRMSVPEDQLSYDSVTTITAIFATTDFANLSVGDVFYEVIGIKYTGDTRFRSRQIKKIDTTTNSQFEILDNWFEVTA